MLTYLSPCRQEHISTFDSETPIVGTDTEVQGSKRLHRGGGHALQVEKSPVTQEERGCPVPAQHVRTHLA